MDVKNLNGLLRTLLVGRSVTEINHYVFFRLSFGREDQKETDAPPSIRVNLYGDWYIKEIGQWDEAGSGFGDVFMFGLVHPFKPLQAFYIHKISQEGDVEDVFIDIDNSLILKIGNFTIVVPPKCDYMDLSWRIDADEDSQFADFSVACNSDENQLYTSLPSKLMPMLE
jgi:hypothetical protein